MEVHDVAGNVTTVTFTLDTTGPVLTEKDGSSETSRSYSIDDGELGSGVAGVRVNGQDRPLTVSRWSDVNDIIDGNHWGALAGENILVAYDALGNETTLTFTLASSVIPQPEQVPVPEAESPTAEEGPAVEENPAVDEGPAAEESPAVEEQTPAGVPDAEEDEVAAPHLPIPPVTSSPEVTAVQLVASRTAPVATSLPATGRIVGAPQAASGDEGVGPAAASTDRDRSEVPMLGGWGLMAMLGCAGALFRRFRA
ncbi:hypothetical protein E8D34_14645 [Nocardioides sp. GY 10113]|nr:hypothetical protein E8D34_14645 [Nocardioides sp. GY 10113]